MSQHKGPLSEKNKRFSVEVRHKNINNHEQQIKNKTHLRSSTHGDITVNGSVSCRIKLFRNFYIFVPTYRTDETHN